MDGALSSSRYGDADDGHDRRRDRSRERYGGYNDGGGDYGQRRHGYYENRGRPRDRYNRRGKGYGGGGKGYGSGGKGYGGGGGGKGYGGGGKGYGGGKGHGGGKGFGGGGMRTHGGGNNPQMPPAAAPRTEQEEEILKLVSFLKTGLDFQQVAEENAAEGEESTVRDRAEIIATTFAANLKKDDTFSDNCRDAILKCASELPIHAPMIGVIVSLMTDTSPTEDDSDEDEDEEEDKDGDDENSKKEGNSSDEPELHGKEFAAKVADAASRAIASCVEMAPRKAKALLHFLASMAAAGALQVGGEAGFGPVVLAPLASKVSFCLYHC